MLICESGQMCALNKYPSYAEYLIDITFYYNKFGQESRAASPAFFPSRA